MRTVQKRNNKGMAVLAVIMILLFGVSIVVFYLNRGVIFEQRISANQMRSTTAQEMAEAGIEWATGMLNTTDGIGVDCGTSAGARSFRQQYVLTNWGTSNPNPADVAPARNVLPGCKVGSGGSCSCPAVLASGSTIASLGSVVLPGFTVQFSWVDDSLSPNPYPKAVRVVSTGCTAQAGACEPNTRGNSDASTSISVVLQMMPALRAVPAGPLTCGTSCAIGSSAFKVVNQDVATGGMLINAGTTISASEKSLFTIPGQPTAGALVAGDPSLSSLAASDPTCSSSSMFGAFFGSDLQQYINSPETAVIDCNSASDCGTKVLAAYQANKRAFYFPSGLALNSSSAPFTDLGSATDGVTIVSPGDISINGNFSIYGMIFSNSANLDDLGTGNSNIYGAIATCGGFKSTGGGTVTYMPSALAGVQNSTARMVRVPGTWTDRCSLGTPLPATPTAATTINCN